MKFIMNQLLNTKQAAELINVTHGTLTTWRQNGKGPDYIKLDNGTVRYSMESIVEYTLNNCMSLTGKSEFTSSVLTDGFLYDLCNNKSFREKLHGVVNEYERQEQFKQCPTTIDQLSPDNIFNLDWALDKLWLNFYLDEEQSNHFIQFTNDDDYLADGTIVINDPKPYFPLLHASIYVDKKRELKFEILVRKNGYKKLYVKIEINPSHYNTKKKTRRLKKSLHKMFGRNAKRLFNESVVSRLDVCIDVKDSNLDHILFLFKYTRTRSCFKFHAKGVTTHKTEGSRKSNRSKGYQKGDDVRIEFELKFKGKERPQFNELAKIKLPFKRFQIYSPSFLTSYGLHPFTIHAIDSLGVKETIKRTSGEERRNLKRALEASQLQWNADKATRKVKKMLSQFTQQFN